jgi:two-component system chemotaxis response regulator CheY
MALNVLIVDDSGVMRAMILKTMKMAGLPLGDVYQAGNGQDFI